MSARARPLAAALLCALAACRDPAAPQLYAVHRARGPIKADGRLDEPAWRDAGWTYDFVRSLDARPTLQRTRAKLLYDDERLYVGFEVTDDYLVTPFRKDDEPLYTSEVVEIFLQPGEASGAPMYYEVELSPNDLVFDASFTGRRQGMQLAWSSGAKHGVLLGGVTPGWTGELAIAFASLAPHAPPRPGDTWRFDLYRLDVDAQGRTEGQALSAPLVGDFHNLARFAFLRFE